MAFFVPASSCTVLHILAPVCAPISASTSLGRSVKWCQAEPAVPCVTCFSIQLISSEIKVLIAVSPRDLCHSAELSAELAAPRSCEDVISKRTCSVNERVFLLQYFGSAGYFLLGRLASFVEFFRCLHFREYLFFFELSDASCHTFLSHIVFQVRFLEYVLHLQPR